MTVLIKITLEMGGFIIKKVLFMATTAKGHLNVFHIPYIKLFKQLGWEVHAITNGDEIVPFTDKNYIVPIERNPLKRNNLKAVRDVIKIMDEERYDFVTCHTPVGGVIARVAAHKTNTGPVMYTAHGFHFFRGSPLINSLVYKSIEKLLANWTDALVTINNEDYIAAKKFKLKNGGKVYKIPGIGVNISKIQNTNIIRLEKCKELGINKESLIILNIAELSKRKNQETIIRTFSQIKTKNAVLLICGTGELEGKLRHLINSLGLENKVKLLGFRKDIDEILKISDIFFFASYQEGLPVAVMEAMAAGLPVLCSDVRGCRDLIEDSKGGYLFNPNDINGFKLSLESLLADQSLREKFGDYNMDVVKKYDVKNVIEEMKQIYDEVIIK